MKKQIVVLMLVLIAAAGCQQRQEPKNQVVYPGGVMMKSPEEIKALEQLAQQAPKNATGWIGLGNALMDSNRYSEAVDAYQKALALDPKNVDVRVDMGTCLKNSGRPQEALAEYRKAIKINPAHLNAHLNSGVVLTYDLYNKQEGIKEFEKYLALAPNAPNAEEIRKIVNDLKAQP